MKLKTRIRRQLFIDGPMPVRASFSYIVEVRTDRRFSRWKPLGADGKITRYEREEDARRAADEAARAEVAA